MQCAHQHVDCLAIYSCAHAGVDLFRACTMAILSVCLLSMCNFSAQLSRSTRPSNVVCCGFSQHAAWFAMTRSVHAGHYCMCGLADRRFSCRGAHEYQKAPRSSTTSQSLHGEQQPRGWSWLLAKLLSATTLRSGASHRHALHFAAHPAATLAAVLRRSADVPAAAGAGAGAAAAAA
jgi:hypothetical protein